MNDDKKKAMQLLKTAKGQTEAIIKMLEEDRYCVDIANQILAVNGLMKKANLAILKQHMEHCVVSAFQEGSEDEKSVKIDEVIKIMNKVMSGK